MSCQATTDISSEPFFLLDGVALSITQRCYALTVAPYRKTGSYRFRTDYDVS